MGNQWHRGKKYRGVKWLTPAPPQLAPCHLSPSPLAPPAWMPWHLPSFCLPCALCPRLKWGQSQPKAGGGVCGRSRRDEEAEAVGQRLQNRDWGGVGSRAAHRHASLTPALTLGQNGNHSRHLPPHCLVFKSMLNGEKKHCLGFK